MDLYHDSRDSRFRKPFGAVKIGTAVRLACEVSGCDPSQTSCTLRLWIDAEGEALIPMEYAGDLLWTATISRDMPAIVWYSFIVSRPGESTRRLGAAPGKQGGVGVAYGDCDVPSFQLTVYKPRESRPDWYEGGMVYQIFPDRFARDESWRDRCANALEKRYRGYERKLIDDWGKPPVYERNQDGSITSWDIYGGSLKGIEEHLPYLEHLGITAIYLNPIFQAASNHRYDTADYMHVDPVLGSDDDFRELCRAAKRHGIGIILDGVFNHTGDDSRYFNRYGTFDEPGALSSAPSPWDDAFEQHDDGSYACWWGVQNMPSLNERSSAVRKLILGKDGVIRHWLRMGASGWRLDVADELSDEFLAQIKRAALEEKPDAIVIGEVWEDASNKISYGTLRRYLLGDELDSAMNYPFRDMVLAFLTERDGYDAYSAADAIESLSENYPPEALQCSLNLLGSHDRPRIISMLDGMRDPDGVPENERASWRVPDERMGLVKARFWLATLLQMTFPGVPSIYYGDEIGMQGLTDPGNRATFPWKCGDPDFATMLQNASGLRRALPWLRDATIKAWAPHRDVLAYTRTGKQGEKITVLINRSRTDTIEVEIPFENEMGYDVIEGDAIECRDNGMAGISLNPLGSRTILWSARNRLQKPIHAGWGVLCHITSIPNGEKTGTLGAPAERFIDGLQAMGAAYWQVLPINPTDSHDSPYAGPSAFAGNEKLLAETPDELKSGYDRFCLARGFDSPAYRSFEDDNAYWLKPYCAYRAIWEREGHPTWTTWPTHYRSYAVGLLEDPELKGIARYHAYLQFRFNQAWCDLVEYAHARGVCIIGDIPIYVSRDSCDAWSNREIFSLDADGEAEEVAGTPPDRFSKTGQIWGNPTYRWDRMRRDGFTWWIKRAQRACSLYDVTRLDHFLGFQSYFSIPAGKDGSYGRWIKGPGIALFETLENVLGPLPFIAEDLGYLTPAVRTLVAQTGFPGMDVMEFMDSDPRDGIAAHPEKILYTSTHDTSTLIGWVHDRWFQQEEQPYEKTRTCAERLLEVAFSSEARLVMVPLQDVLRLDDSARMNIPGTVDGNWSWQAYEEAFERAISPMRALVDRMGRTGHPAS